MRRALFIGLPALFAVLVALTVVLNQGPSPEVIAARCRAAQPRWSSYQEDIKGQVGAAPVASWTGEPVGAVCEGVEVSVTFRLSPPWSDYPAAIPVLLRSPTATVHAACAIRREGSNRTYVFELPDSAVAGSLPWVEVRYPHNERKLYFEPDGVWNADGRGTGVER